MNPLSPFTHMRRNPASAAVRIAVIAAAVAALHLFLTLAQETYVAPTYEINRYLEVFSLVQPDGVPALDPDLCRRIASSPYADLVLPQRNVRIKVPNVGGAYFPFRLFGLKEADAEEVMGRCGAFLVDGRLPEPGSNGVALSVEIVEALGLRIGDTFDVFRDPRLFLNITAPLVLSGILRGGPRLGIMSYELMDSVSVSPFMVEGLLVLPKKDKRSALEAFLRDDVRGPTVRVVTNSSRADDVSGDQRLLFLIGVPVLILAALAVCLVIAAMDRLVHARRMRETGALYCTGRSRSWLASRLVRETGVIGLAGWSGGILVSWAALAAVSAAVYSRRGFPFPPFGLPAVLLVLVIPVTVTVWSLISSARAVRKLDAVSIVEKGELALEGEKQSRLRTRASARPRPLSSRVYWSRHLRLASFHAAAAAMMILGAALVIAVLSAGTDALQPGFNNLSRVSAVAPLGRPLSRDTLTLIQENPDVERIIPLYDFSPLKIAIPPMFPEYPVQTLAVSQADMEYLMGLYGLTLQEGRPPRAGTNEIVLPWQVAKNRRIKVGDVIGDPYHPAYPNAAALPVPLTVSGILAPAAEPSKETWLSFASLEFVERYRMSDLSLIIAPRPGAKMGLDKWLGSVVPRREALVYTYASYRASVLKEMRAMIFSFALMGGCITVAAVLAIAGLTHGLLSVRKGELGALGALGFSPWTLCLRTARESAVVMTAAWLVAMAGMLLILVFLRNALFDPAGLRPDLLNPVPWLFTLPVPVVSLPVSLIVCRRIVSRIDPVAVIEGR